MQGNVHDDCKEEIDSMKVRWMGPLVTGCLLMLSSMVPLADATAPCGDVYFQTDMFALTAVAQDTLRCHAASLSGHPTRKLRLEGHTDERGTPSYSLIFGDRRAKSARHYLIEGLGVAADRIVVTSYGAERPVCRAHTPACWARNRRVHVVVVEGTP